MRDRQRKVCIINLVILAILLILRVPSVTSSPSYVGKSGDSKNSPSPNSATEEHETIQTKSDIQKVSGSRSTMLNNGAEIGRSGEPASKPSITAEDPMSPSASSTARTSVASNRSLEKSLLKVQSLSFISCLSTTIMGFAPAPFLVSKVGPDKATSVLAALTTTAAITEMMASSSIGTLVDRKGRKPLLIAAALAMSAAAGIVSIHPTVLSVCICRFVSQACRGLVFLALQTMISDIFGGEVASGDSSARNRLSSALGLQGALVVGGLCLGAIISGQLVDYNLSVCYGVSTFLLFLTSLFAKLGIEETLPESSRFSVEKTSNEKKIIPFFDMKTLLTSVASSTKLLFRHGREMRMLAIILMLQQLPACMGDFFQIFVKTEWKVTTKEFSSFIAMYSLIGIVANSVGSILVRKIGVRHFTGIAILSSACPPLGASLFGFKGLVAGMLVGFLNGAQSICIFAELISRGTKSGIPQGELAGERASLMAALRVIGPLFYSLLYSQGKKIIGISYLPFVMNVGLALAAFVISQATLS